MRRSCLSRSRRRSTAANCASSAVVRSHQATVPAGAERCRAAAHRSRPGSPIGYAGSTARRGTDIARGTAASLFPSCGIDFITGSHGSGTPAPDGPSSYSTSSAVSRGQSAMQVTRSSMRAAFRLCAVTGLGPDRCLATEFALRHCDRLGIGPQTFNITFSQVT